ncbi:MAG: radical SAM family heme chaperone HemW [Candidatus Sumerlaeaceae bacterium]
METSPGHFIYVHVPFCKQKCSYCDFFTITDPSGMHPLAPVWLELCAREADLWVKAGDMDLARPVQTVFFGGGTPSLLEPKSIESFLRTLRESFGFLPDVEITLETQPDTVDLEKLAAFSAAGINRFSIGVQTFDAATLAQTGRRHSVQQSRSTLQAATATGEVVSLDLICAWPGQTLDQWMADLEEALSFTPAHISVYELTYHEGTLLERDRRAGRVSELDEQLRISMFEHTRSTLGAEGFEHYEISNYARPRMRSLHNQNYWQLGNYIGLGAGAHSLVFPNRYENPNSAGDYARAIERKRLFRRLSNTSDPDVFLAENLQMAIRSLDGVDLDWFGKKIGRDVLSQKRSRIEGLASEGLLELYGSVLRLTPQGQLRSDSIIGHLL